MKYAASSYHHSGMHLGGYFPPSGYPQGDAGLKGVRPNGDRLFAVGLEPQGGSYPGNQTHLDTYANWVDMPGAAFNGQYYGRQFLPDLNVPIGAGAWHCLEVMLKMNRTANGHDGEYALWVNGTLQRHFRPGTPNGQFDSSGTWVETLGGPHSGGQWRDVPTYGIHWVKLQNYDDMGTADNMLVEDLVIATSYIGPLHAGAVDTLASATPTNLQVAP